MKRMLLSVVSGLALASCHSTPTVNPSVGSNANPGRPTTSGGPTQTQRAAAARANMTLGLGYLQQGNLPIAKEKLDKARSEDPDLPDIHGAMALLDERLGKDKEADKEFRAALKIDPHDPAMLNNYAVFLCSHGKPDEGVRNFEQAASNPLYSTPWAAYTNAGVCLRAAHRDAEARPRFDRALRSNPAYSEAVFQSADLDLQQQKYPEARFLIDLFLLRNPATPDLLLLAWRVAQAQNDPTAQQKYAARLAQEFPNSEQSRALTPTRPNPG
ncbi:MAG TPA: type IV pilus biogenesis/stability protein PilW [Steroidobacteraceae bacterium]|jgi:type IV pilus assembly protein PilF|nr:type IV pilus biogenesis/stability protein PilW [Steroidobacteraceae bacterium]